MKHLKLLVLLMVVAVATMSYAQAVVVGEDTYVEYNGGVTYVADSMMYAIMPMTEGGMFVSAEQGSSLTANAFSIPVSVMNLQVMTATMRDGSHFGLMRDPNVARMASRMSYTAQAEQAFFDVWVSLRTEEAGYFTDTVILASNVIGMPQVGIVLQGQVFPADTTSQGGDSTIVGEPYLSVSTTQLTLTGANPESWTLASGMLTINAENVGTLQLQMQSGWYIQMATADGYFTDSKSYNLNSAITSITERILLNTVSAGTYTDVLVISAPGTNLQPVYVNISAVVEASQGNDSAAYVAIEDFPNPLTMQFNQGEDVVLSIPVSCRNIDSLTVFVGEPFSVISHQIVGFGNNFARYYSNEISEDGLIYVNVQVGTSQAGQFDHYIYVYANEGYPDYTLSTSITVVGDSTYQGGDTTQTGVYMNVPASGQTFIYQTVKDESPFDNLTTILVQHQGINSFNAYFASGQMFGIKDQTEEGYTVFTGFKQFFPGEGEEYTGIEVAPLSNEPGTFNDILYIVATGETGMVQFAYQINFSLTVTDNGGGQGGDTTAMQRHFDVLQAGETFSFDMMKDQDPQAAMMPIEVAHRGVSSFTATLASGYYFCILDPVEDGGIAYLSSKQFYVSDVDQLLRTNIWIAPLTYQPGTFSDVLFITSNDGQQNTFAVYFTLTVTDSGQGGDTTQHYFYIDENPQEFYFTQGDEAFASFTMSFMNPGEINVTLAQGRFMSLRKTYGGYNSNLVNYGEDETMYTDWKEFYLIPNTNQAGIFWDTIVVQPSYGIREYRIPVTINVAALEPRFELLNETWTINKDASATYIDFIYAEAYVENVDSVRYWLADGTAFKLYNNFGDWGMPDSLRYATELTNYVNYFGNHNWWYFWTVLETTEAGNYVDTLYYQPYGMDSIFHMVLYGSVSDFPNRRAFWQDRNVIVQLIGDSLIVSGSGSTSDYGYNYVTGGEWHGESPWSNDIRRRVPYDSFPKYLLVKPGVSRIGDCAFYQLRFRTAEIHADSLGYNIMQYNQVLLDTVILGEEIRYASCEAFANSAQVVINNITQPYMDGCEKAFAYLVPNTVVANTMNLLQINNPTTVPVEPANDSIRDLYVAYGYYYYMPETGYDLVVTDYLTLDNNVMAELPQKPSMLLEYDQFTDTANTAHVDVPIDANIALGKFVKKDYIGGMSQFYTFAQMVEENWYQFQPFYTGTMTTLINNDGMMTADTVVLREKVATHLWTFMGLPFNQKVSDIRHREDHLICIRRFNAEKQADGDVLNVWDDVEDDDTLHAGEAFIIQPYSMNGGDVEVTFTALDDAQKQGIFNPSVRTLALEQHPSEDAWNANWNLLVNPYPSFYDTRNIGNNGIITVYSSHSGRMWCYESFSIQDDYYVLQPHEAFFYQAAAGETSLRMPLEGRQHTAAAAGIEYVDPWANDSVIYEDGGRMTPERSTRTLLNFYLAQNGGSDRVRVVLNENAQMAYEVGRDALKMKAQDTEAAQFYAEQGGAQQSILERPLNDGIVVMGVDINTAGDCTISLPDTKGLNVTLYDTQTGAMTNLSLSDYTFYGVPGQYNGRFIIGLVGSTTAIENYLAGGMEDGVKKIIENGHVYILRGSDKYDVLGKKQ